MEGMSDRDPCEEHSVPTDPEADRLRAELGLEVRTRFRTDVSRRTSRPTTLLDGNDVIRPD
jgi:hypothetical protein